MATKDTNNSKPTLDSVFNVTRFTVVVAIFAAIAGQLLMLYIGLVKVYDAIILYITKASLEELDLPVHLSHADVATALTIEAIDAFLIALVLFYFALAVYRIFLAPAPEKGKTIPLLSIAPASLGELKETLAQVILVILFVLFARSMWLSFESLEWTDLILPASIALLALSIKLANFK